jgi:hypothetical protein
VRPADFAAQDVNQSRLWRELAVSGIEYHYKPTDERTISESSRVLLEEAAFALACFSGRLEDIVTARRAPGQLSDPNNPVYSRLFSTGLTGASLYRKVNAFRLLSKIADETERASPAHSSEKIFYRHMRFFVMHFIKRRHAGVLAQPDLTLSGEDVETLSRAFNELGDMIQELGKKYLTEAQSGYLAVSRNLTACTQLAQRVQTALDEKGK